MVDKKTSLSFKPQKYSRLLRSLMTIIKHFADFYQFAKKNCGLLLLLMVFSKSFGYALRAILYIALSNKQKENIQLDEIAEQLALPRHFLGKVMNKLTNEGILNSIKGPHGGFSITEETLQTTLIKIIEITGESEQFDSCVLRLRKCNAANPCPLHAQIESLKNQWYQIVSTTTVDDLIKKEQPDFIRSIAII